MLQHFNCPLLYSYHTQRSYKPSSYMYVHLLPSSAANSHVWQYDGNIQYLEQNNLPLLLFGVLIIIIIIILYLTILLMAPCLQNRSHWWGFQWVNKLKPFYDSYMYQVPFKDRYRFWPGVLLFIHLPLYLVFILSDSKPVKMLAIIACVLMYLCIAVLGYSCTRSGLIF